MDFAGALAYLDDHINREATAGATRGLSLDRIRGIVDVLGDPHRAAPVIHITGTNGKGSVARMISSVLAAHGLVAGTYASPHLESITERIRRNDEPISPDAFAEVVADLASLEPLFPQRPSYFDLLTAAAFSWFAHEAVDVMVIEVGMLGRFDSTNVVDADVAVITNVGGDHTDYVGDWRRAIASEKAGIIKPGSTAVVGETDPDLVEVFRAEGGARTWVRGVDFDVEASVLAFGGRQCDFRLPSGTVDDLFLPAHGDHQVDNAVLALTAIEAFFDRPLERDVAATGLAALELPGRFEVVSRSPLVVLDAAHNPHGTAACAATYTQEFHPEGTLTLVVGMLDRPDLPDALEPLLALRPARVVITRADSPRAVAPTRLRELIGERAQLPVEIRIEDDVAGAVDRALDLATDVDAVLVAGSAYVVGSARTAMRRRGLFADG